MGGFARLECTDPASFLPLSPPLQQHVGIETVFVKTVIGIGVQHWRA